MRCAIGTATDTEPDVVDLGDVDRGAAVVLRLLLVAEHAEREQREVDVADPLEHVGDEAVVRRGVAGVERHRLDPRRTRGAELLRGRAQRLGIARGQHHRAGPALHELAHRRQRDVRTAAEHQHRLHRSERILHVEPFT